MDLESCRSSERCERILAEEIYRRNLIDDINKDFEALKELHARLSASDQCFSCASNIIHDAMCPVELFKPRIG